MAEGEAAHVRSMEEIALTGELRERRFGQLCGLGIGVLALSMSGLALVLGHEAAAIVLGGAPLAGLVSVFVVGRLKKSPEKKSPPLQTDQPPQ